MTDDPYESSLADTLKGVAIPDDWQKLFSNSNCAALFPSLAMNLMQHEEAMYAKIGIPEGWDRPLMPKLDYFKEFIKNYLRTTPSVRHKHLELVLNAVGEAAKRPPKINFDAPNLDEDLSTPLPPGAFIEH